MTAQHFAALAIIWIITYALIASAWSLHRAKSTPARRLLAGSAGMGVPETQPERVESSAPRPVVVGGDRK